MTLRRTSAESRVIALARELAEDYVTVPLPAVSEAVRSAAAVVDPVARDTETALQEIERNARRELAELSRAG
jgi:hypothetical protein